MNRKSREKGAQSPRTIQIVLHVEFGHIHVNAMRMRRKRQKTNKHNNYLLVRDVLNVSAQYVHQMERCFMRWSLRVTCDSWQCYISFGAICSSTKQWLRFIVMKKMLLTLQHHTFHFNLNPVLSRSGNTFSNVTAIDAGIHSNTYAVRIPFWLTNQMNRSRIWLELLGRRKKKFSQKLRYQFRLNSDADALWTEPWQSKRFTTNYLICLDNQNGRSVSLYFSQWMKRSAHEGASIEQKDKYANFLTFEFRSHWTLMRSVWPLNLLILIHFFSETATTTIPTKKFTEISCAH